MDQSHRLAGIAFLSMMLALVLYSPALADPGAERAAADQHRAAALAAQQARVEAKRTVVRDAKAEAIDRVAAARDAGTEVVRRGER